jgi:hypothetical protein
MNELIKLQKNIERMPREIINLILFYTYSFQPKCLTEDIKSIYDVKKDLLVMYRYHWQDECNDWLINDIFAYANGYNATMYGYIDKFYYIFLRHVGLKNRLHVEKYIGYMRIKNVISQINIFLGLMDVEERNQFVQFTIEDFKTH